MSTRAAAGLRPDYTPHVRAERLIATGRLILSLASLTAVYLDPSTPARFQNTTYSLLVIYSMYAFVAAIVAWQSPVPSTRWRLVSHVLDLLLFSLFVYLTEGPASPFFLYFVFSLFCATLRFSWRGILATAITAMAIYGAMAVAATLGEGGADVSRAVIRLAYLGVIAALLVYLGLYQQQLRRELASLAAWPRELAADRDEVLRVALAHAAAVLRADRVILMWEEPEEPWLYAAVLNGGEFRVERLAPAEASLEVDDDLRNASVLARPDSSSMLVYDPALQTVTERAGDPLDRRVLERYGVSNAIVATLESETLNARLIVPGVRAATADDLALTHIAGRLVVAAIEQFFFVQQVRQTASAEERLRISRDLHDGIVQSLAGVGLILQTIRARTASDPELAEQLVHVQAVVEEDQRELRSIVRELRLRDDRDGAQLVADEMERMRDRFPLEWGLTVETDLSGPLPVTSRLAHHLCRIVNESLANAARHGNASHATVAISGGAGSIHVVVRDNGRGFPFTGRRDLAELERNGHGPRTLKERVRNLGGSLVVESSAAGAAIEVHVPLQEPN